MIGLDMIRRRTNKFIRHACVLFLGLILGGCSTFSFPKNQSLSPKDTVAIKDGSSDEHLINKDHLGEQGFVAYGFDVLKTEYNYTTADILKSLYFNFESVKISKVEHVKIVDMAKIFLKDLSLYKLIIGNCAKFGGEQYHKSLGKRHAEAIRSILISLPSSEEKIRTGSCGSTQANLNLTNQAEGAFDRRCNIVLQVKQSIKLHTCSKK
jgi:outer membrane protein OmpA-like peptidoglycan-associated protein